MYLVPKEIYRIIFEFININDCINYSNASKQNIVLKQCITKIYSLPRDVKIGIVRNLKNINHIELFYHSIKDNHLKYFKYLPHLRNLFLSDCEFISDAGLETISKYKTLLKLKLESSYKITNQGLRYIHKLNLELLDIAGCENITDSGLMYLSSTLKELNINNCYQITDYGLVNLQNIPLDVLDCSTIYNNTIGDKGIKNISTLKLKVLNLGGCDNITDEGLYYLRNCFSLEKLDLSYCYNITKKGLEYLSGLKIKTLINKK